MEHGVNWKVVCEWWGYCACSNLGGSASCEDVVDEALCVKDWIYSCVGSNGSVQTILDQEGV